MSTLAQRLPEIIREAEAEHGSDNPFVQHLKKQLAECQARDPNKKPSEATYFTGTGPMGPGGPDKQGDQS